MLVSRMKSELIYR